MRWGLIVGVFALTGLLAGCGGEKVGEVAGTVLMGGKPLPEGEIIFESEDGTKAPGAGPIRDGKYSVSMPPGPKKVKITASRPTKKPDPVMGSAAREALIDPEFNERTTLKANIQAGKNADVNFEVKALP